MIVVKIMGGLGNQMFQYAFSRELALIYGEQVCYDIDSFLTDKQRNLALYNLNVPKLMDWKMFFSETERKKIIREQKIYRIRQKIRRLVHHSDRVGVNLYKEYLKKGRYYNFDPYFYSLPKLEHENIFSYGYFQGEAYFQHVICEIRSAFSVIKPINEEEEMLSKIMQCNAVCIHIRIGDYKNIKNRRFDVIDRDYFKRGVTYIKNHIENPVFFVFTNDPDTVKSQYQLSDVNYVIGYKDYQDMRLMMACKHFIISNSTFSWWASYLADNPQKIIVVPKKWRKNQESEPSLMNCNKIDYIKL